MTVMTLMSYAIVIAFVVWVISRSAKSSAADSFGSGYAYAYVRENTGIAVSPERKMIKLKEGSREQEYPLDMVRSWESSLQTGGFAVGTGLNAASHNLGRGMANKRASGLFVYTKDIDNATWRVAMYDQREQAKWMEILQQCVNESR